MANEIHAFSISGLTLYAVLINSTGQVWDGATFVAINPVNWTSYDIPLTEAAAGIYLASMPIVVADIYDIGTYERLGVNPAITDTLRGTGWLAYGGAIATPAIIIAGVINGLLGNALISSALKACQDLTLYRGDSWTQIITGLGDLTANTDIWFGIKANKDDTDASAIAIISRTVGLEVLNGAVALVPGQGVITVLGAPTDGIVQIDLDEAATALLVPEKRYWDCQKLVAGRTTTPKAGHIIISADIVRTVI